MGLLCELLLLPLAPARFTMWTVDRVIAAAREEHGGPAAVRRDLAELSRMLDQGLIDADEFDWREDEILDRWAAGPTRDASPGTAGSVARGEAG